MTIWARATRWWDFTWPPINRGGPIAFSRYADEERITGYFAWARVLERWLSGSRDGAETLAALERARKVNPIAEPFVSARDRCRRKYRLITGPSTKARRRCRARTSAGVGAEPGIPQVAAQPGKNCVAQGRMSTSAMPQESSGRIELLQGTLDMLILRTLLFGPAHGHRIAKHIQRTTDDLLQVEH